MNEDHRIPYEQALARLDIVPNYDSGNGPQDHVHTLLASPIGPLGAHWTLEDVKEAGQRYGFYEAGENAASLGHGMVIPDGTDPNRVKHVYVACRPAP